MGAISKKDGTRIFVIHSAGMVYDSAGRYEGTIGSFVDITELVQARLKAEQADAAKAEFLADIGHELKTPLQSILSYSTFGLTRADSAPTEKIKDYFHKIEKSGKSLLMLMEDLLDLSKLDAGRMNFEFDFQNISIVTAEVIDEFRPAAEEKRLTIETEMKYFGGNIIMDLGKIKQVIRNILSNAVKFSPEESVIVCVLESAGDMIRFSVSDAGPGIPDDQLEEVFKKFVQSRRTRSGAGGTNAQGGATVTFEIPPNPHKDIVSADDDAELEQIVT